MAKNQKPSRDNEVVFKSYQDVITKNMKAGKDVTRLTKRLNTLLTKFRKLLKKTKPGLFPFTWLRAY